MTGGEWVERDFLRNRPYNPDDRLDRACDRSFDEEAYDAWKDYEAPPIDGNLEGNQGDASSTALECDGSGIVAITVGDPETSSQGHCRYLVHYRNQSTSEDVYIYHFDIHTNPSAGLNQEWYREAVLSARGEYSEFQTVFATGETSVTEKVAVIFTSAACHWIGNDQTALDEISQELSNPCR
jgi:hypothetical protein